MNILDNYLTERHSTPDTSNADRVPVQRAYEEDTYDYLPEGFDPTPSFYNFNQATDVDSTPTHETPIQRNVQDDVENDEQPVDLFQALSQAGMVNKAPDRPVIPQSPIQRDDQDDGDDYSEYGDATWAEFNNYTPPTEHVTGGDTPIQRTAQDDVQNNEQPVDLFQALSQAGMMPRKQSNSTSSDHTPIQRSSQPSDDDSGLNSETIDLYNAMLQSGMIQDSSQTSSSSNSNSEPVQRSPQTKTDMLSRATQVSGSSVTHPSDSSIDNIIHRVIQRTDDTTTVASNDSVSNSSTNLGDMNENSEENDKEYLNQLARDVFRVIKTRLRQEKERRG
jgi:hypothetical protein